MFGDPCRFCSEETNRQVVRFSIIKDCELGKKGEGGKKVRRIELGHFCNNDGKHYVNELKYCPARWAQTRPLSKEAEELVKDVIRRNSSIIVSRAIRKGVTKAIKKHLVVKKKPAKKTTRRVSGSRKAKK